MFPVSDVIPSRTTPLVTFSLIALTVAGFLYQLHLDVPGVRLVVERHGVRPVEFAWPALITSLFLHAGWVHVATNVLYLWLFGANVEDMFGHGRFLLFYVGCGTLASAAFVLASPSSALPLTGASGAMAGVMGAYLVLYPGSRILTATFVLTAVDLIEIPAVFFVGVWVLVQLFNGVGSIGVETAPESSAFWTHVAGFSAGALCGAYSRFGSGAGRRYWL
jgi:membrane associated rhomboid family serine protease